MSLSVYRVEYSVRQSPKDEWVDKSASIGASSKESAVNAAKHSALSTFKYFKPRSVTDRFTKETWDLA